MLLATLFLLGAVCPTPPINVPSPGNSTVPAFVSVVGTRDAPGDPAPDPTGAFRVVVRDFTNNPIPEVSVAVDLSNCNAVRLCSSVVNGQVVHCEGNRVEGCTDESGEAIFYLLGAGLNDGLGSVPADGPGCVEIWAADVLLASSSAIVYDQNGAVPGSGHNGVDSSDLTLSIVDVLTFMYNPGPLPARSAYAMRSGSLGPLDLSHHKEIVLRSLAGQGSGTGCADATGMQSYCP